MNENTEATGVKTVSPGIGLDIGTMNIVSARREGASVRYRQERDTFLDIPEEHEKNFRGVNKKSVVHREGEDVVYLVGDSALRIAQTLGREVRRPLKDGLISPGEEEGLDILAVILKKVLGEPVVENEVCYFSVPASPIDADRDVVYHQGVFSRIVEQCGYTPEPSNEAMAIIFSECANEDFSGIAISFGAGMCNIALAVEGVEGMTFSVSRGGDWIDKLVAKSLDTTASNICALKEKVDGKGDSIFNLMDFDLNNRVHESLALYFKDLIRYCISNIAKEFKKRAKNITLPKDIPMVLSGGTTMAGGFVEFFKKEFERKRKRFPIGISEIRHATNPLNAVADGMLTQALLENED